jgi:hypothetical protein
MTGTMSPVTKLENDVIAHDPMPVYDVFKFRRFRLNLIGFLKLPLDIREDALRNAIKGCSVNLLATYLTRAERVRIEFENQPTSHGQSKPRLVTHHDTSAERRQAAALPS